MKIANLPQIKEQLVKRLPEYLVQNGYQINGTKVQCPNKTAHQHGDTQKLSAAYLPDSNKTKIYCFVENRIFDIFNVWGILNNKGITGKSFYMAVQALAKHFGIPIQLDQEFSLKEKERFQKRLLLESIHKISLGHMREGIDFYNKRRLSKAKIKHYQIGFILPEHLDKAFYKKFQRMFDFQLATLFTRPSLVIPIFDEYNQYSGIIIHQDIQSGNEEKYLNLMIDKKTLFNLNNITNESQVTLVEGVFDAIALYPQMNVIACLTSVLNEKGIEYLAQKKFKTIELALDADNLYTNSVKDGVLRTTLRLANMDANIKVVKLDPDKTHPTEDPDSYMATHSLEEFNKLPRIHAIQYLVENVKKEILDLDKLYQFVGSCPNLIRKEKYLNVISKVLDINKRALIKKLDSITETKNSYNLIKYVQEKDCFQDMCEHFIDAAWNKQFQGMPSGYPLFDKHIGGFEDTLYTFIGFPEMGKSSFLLNFVHNLAKNPDNYVAFYSLDDGAHRSVVPRLLSIISGLSSKNIRTPLDNVKDIWYTGMTKFQSYKDNLIIKDGSEIRTVFDFEEFVTIHYHIAKEKHKKLIVIIDNLHDLVYSGKLESTQNTMRVAGILKRLPQKLNCPILATAEVPKSSKDRPTGKDIKESIDLWYASRFVGGIFSASKQKADYSHLVWKENEVHKPIMELIVSKNQTGEAFHGSLYYKFNPDNSRLVECTEEEHKLLKEKQHLF